MRNALSTNPEQFSHMNLRQLATPENVIVAREKGRLGRRTLML